MTYAWIFFLFRFQKIGFLKIQNFFRFILIINRFFFIDRLKRFISTIFIILKHHFHMNFRFCAALIQGCICILFNRHIQLPAYILYTPVSAHYITRSLYLFVQTADIISIFPSLSSFSLDCLFLYSDAFQPSPIPFSGSANLATFKKLRHL